MAVEESVKRRQAFVGSYLGLLLGWVGILVIAAGIALALRELNLYSATKETLIYWGAVAAGCTAVVYAVIMFAITWSFARGLGLQFLPSMAFAIWGAIPVGNLLPFILLMVLAGREADDSVSV